MSFAIFLNKVGSILVTEHIYLHLNYADIESRVLGDCHFIAYAITRENEKEKEKHRKGEGQIDFYIKNNKAFRQFFSISTAVDEF